MPNQEPESANKKKTAKERRDEITRRSKDYRKLSQFSSRRMTKTIKLSTNKIATYVVLLLLQIGVVAFGLTLLAPYLNISVFLIVAKSVGLITAIYIINSKIPNEYKITWIVFVLGLTMLGTIAYYIFGKKPVSKRKRKKLGAKIDAVLDCVQDESVMAAAKEKDEFLAGTAKYIFANGKMPLSTARECEYFAIGEDYFDRLKEELAKAKEFIFIESFIIAEGRMWDEVFEIISEKAKSGVDVRIIYDDLGCLTVIPKSFSKKCLDAGIKTYCFNKLRPVLDVAQNNRTHRKIYVIDGLCAFTGGLNIADEYINLVYKHGHWKDTGAMIKGGAVSNFTRMFLLTWSAKFGSEDISKFFPDNNAPRLADNETFCVPFCDTPASGNAICEDLYIKIIYNAKDYVYINTPYLIITDKVRDALISAAKSGVDVRITVPYIPDKKFVFALTRAFYIPLVLAGVKVYEYKPGFIHAKSIVSDDKYSVIGSSNMDFRSFYLHYECDIFMYDGIAKDLRDDYEQTCTYSKLVSRSQAEKTSMLKRLSGALLRLFAPLM